MKLSCGKVHELPNSWDQRFYQMPCDWPEGNQNVRIHLLEKAIIMVPDSMNGFIQRFTWKEIA
jgi:hypothetical protein